MTDTDYNRTSPFISNSLHYFSKIYQYVGEFAYIWSLRAHIYCGTSAKKIIFFAEVSAYICQFESGKCPASCTFQKDGNKWITENSDFGTG